MSVGAYPFNPALRLVNSSGVQIAGRYELAVSSFTAFSGPNWGVYLGRTDVSYTPEMIGPMDFANWRRAGYLLGYRANITLEFPLVEQNPASAQSFGLGLLMKLFNEGLKSGPSYCALQFNLFCDNAAGVVSPPFPATPSPWRGVYPTSTWNPTWAGGKQQANGFTLTLTLETPDLIETTAPGPGLWTTRTW